MRSRLPPETPSSCTTPNPRFDFLYLLGQTRRSFAHLYAHGCIWITGAFFKPDILSQTAVDRLRQLAELAPPIARSIVANQREHDVGFDPFFYAFYDARNVDWEAKAIEKLQARFERAVIELALLRKEWRERRKAELLGGQA